MAKVYRHPYNRAARPNELTRPPLPEWLSLTLSAHRRRGKSHHSYVYWKRMYWATPPWLTEAHIQEMAAMYLKAGDNEVDHEVPLSHPYVCGLNVPWNLRVIPRRDNQLKTNDCFYYKINFEQGDLFLP